MPDAVDPLRKGWDISGWLSPMNNFWRGGQPVVRAPSMDPGDILRPVPAPQPKPVTTGNPAPAPKPVTTAPAAQQNANGSALRIPTYEEFARMADGVSGRTIQAMMPMITPPKQTTYRDLAFQRALGVADAQANALLGELQNAKDPQTRQKLQQQLGATYNTLIAPNWMSPMVGGMIDGN